MNTAEKIKIIESLIESYRAMSASADSMLKLLGITADCDALNPFWKAFDKYVEVVSNLVGDSSDWLTWYIWDNKCGERQMAAGYGGKLKPIKTVKDLVRLIEKGQTK